MNMLSARELMANNSIPLQGTQAAAHAVQALFGNHNQGTLKSMVMGNRARYALEQARRARDQNIGFSGITPESVQQALHVDPAMAQVLSSELHAKLNPRETTGAMGDMQKNDIRMRALAAVMGQPMPGATAVPDASGAPGSPPGSVPGGAPAGAPDVNLANRLLMVLQGRPGQVSRVADGMAFNPLMTPDAQTMHPTQTGTAMIGERNAQAHAADALAAKRGTGANGSHKVYRISSSDLNAYFTKYGQYGEKKGIDQQAVKDAQVWFSQHPGTSMGDYLLHQKKAAAAPAPAPAPATGSSASGPHTDQVGNKYPTPSSKSEYDALPSGTVYFNPADGQYHRKP